MLSGQSVVRVISQDEPRETIIIKRCKMPEEFDSSNISEEELEKILADLENVHDDDLEYMGDEELDDADVPEISEDEMSDDIEDEYL